MQKGCGPCNQAEQKSGNQSIEDFAAMLMDSDAKAFAERTLPTLHKHLKAATSVAAREGWSTKKDSRLGGGRLLRRHRREGIELEIDRRARKLIRYAGRVAHDVTSREHGQDPVAKLLHQLTVAEPELTR
jgi:hypothetical protein